METSDKNCTNEVKAHPEQRQLALPKEDHFMDFVIACILLEIAVYLSLLICYRLHLFIGSLRFPVTSIFLTLSVETIRMIIAHTINISLLHIFISFPVVCTILIYLFDRIHNIAFSIPEYGVNGAKMLGVWQLALRTKLHSIS